MKQNAFIQSLSIFWSRTKKVKLHVFDKDGLYLATKKIGKNNTKAEQIRADNEKRMQWNREVDRAIVQHCKRYGYQTVQDFYRAYHTAKNAYIDYQDKVSKWEETYGTKVKSDTIHGRMQNYQRYESAWQSEQATQRKDRGVQ